MKSKLFPLCFALLGFLCPAVAKIHPAYKLIAHRGGVVEDKFPDNSAPALHAAIARGYWGLEIDIRETKDGVLVMRHDPDLKLYYNDPRQLLGMSLATGASVVNHGLHVLPLK